MFGASSKDAHTTITLVKASLAKAKIGLQWRLGPSEGQISLGSREDALVLKLLQV